MRSEVVGVPLGWSDCLGIPIVSDGSKVAKFIHWLTLKWVPWPNLFLPMKVLLTRLVNCWTWPLVSLSSIETAEACPEIWTRLVVSLLNLIHECQTKLANLLPEFLHEKLRI